MVDLSVEFCGVKFENPLVLASGVLGITGDGMARVIEHGAGGVTSKSWWDFPHKGHPNPTMFGNESWFMNAVGLPDAGPEKAAEEIARYRKKTKAPFIANIVGGVMEDFGKIAAKVPAMKPDLVELNISCPNVHDEFGKPMACSVSKAAEVTSLVRQRLDENGGKDLKLIVKLSPNVEDIVSIGRSVLDAGADGLTAVNTFGPAMHINIETRQHVLANRYGGLSGPAVKPMTIRIVHDLYRDLKVNGGGVPIVGTGGISTGRDAIEVMMAGATLVGMGTAVHLRGPEVFGLVRDEMIAWCEANGVQKLSDLIGTVHENS